jgi:hypothetical protein
VIAKSLQQQRFHHKCWRIRRLAIEDAVEIKERLIG